MTDTSTPLAKMLAERAHKLRQSLGLSACDVAEQAGVDEKDVIAFEQTGLGSNTVMLAIHSILSGESALEHLFEAPRFRSLDEVVEFERKRLPQR